MNFDDIQKTWRSPHNQPSAGQLEKDKMKFLNDLHKCHRGESLFMVWILAVLSLLTGILILHLIRPDPEKPPTNLTKEWAVLVLLALPWLCLGVFYSNFRAHRARHPNPDRSIRASVLALLDENETATERYKWVGRLNAAVLLLMPLLVYQLRAAGKAGNEILVPALVLLPLLLLGVFLAMRWYHRRVLLPRRRQLETLLLSYGEDEART
jgi:hypothetical protein